MSRFALVAICLLATVSLPTAYFLVRAIWTEDADSRVHAPPGAGYSFRIGSNFELLEYRRPSRPEGSPVSVFQGPNGELIAATWHGLAAIDRPVGVGSVGTATAHVERVLRGEEDEHAARVRMTRAYDGFFTGPISVSDKRFPTKKYFVRHTEADGTTRENHVYVVFRLGQRTPFILRCTWPAHRGVEDDARAACDEVRGSLALESAPVTK